MVQVNSVHLLINIVLILYWIVEQAISPHPKKIRKKSMENLEFRPACNIFVT